MTKVIPVCLQRAGAECLCGNAVYYREGVLERVAGENQCFHWKLYWTGISSMTLKYVG